MEDKKVFRDSIPKASEAEILITVVHTVVYWAPAMCWALGSVCCLSSISLPVASFDRRGSCSTGIGGLPPGTLCGGCRTGAQACVFFSKAPDHCHSLPLSRFAVWKGLQSWGFEGWVGARGRQSLLVSGLLGFVMAHIGLFKLVGEGELFFFIFYPWILPQSELTSVSLGFTLFYFS